MAANTLKNNWTLTLCLLLSGCLEPYQPPVTDEEVNFLVVDGFVNTSNHTVDVTLSRALVLWKVASPKPETDAQVILEEKSGSSYTLNALPQGKYAFSSADIMTGKEYRLYIRTQSGEEYRSQYIAPLQSPPIDSVNWIAGEDGVYITVDTHDDTNQTHYYRWDFIETWSYKSAFASDYKLEGGVPVLRSAQERIYQCYKSVPSVKINTATTTRLSEDQIDNYEVTFIPAGTQKISDIYSILVNQYALSKPAYEYWEQLKKNTETLGSLFDPQPSRVAGNIQNINNQSEPVIGYFDGGSTTQARIFVRFRDLPDHLKISVPQVQCDLLDIGVSEVSTLPSFYLITTPIVSGVSVIGYNYSTVSCVDCRYFGGTTTKPDFWP
jgi:hypothetical protein